MGEWRARCIDPNRSATRVTPGCSSQFVLSLHKLLLIAQLPWKQGPQHQKFRVMWWSWKQHCGEVHCMAVMWGGEQAEGRSQNQSNHRDKLEKREEKRKGDRCEDDCRCRGSKTGHIPWVILFFNFPFLNVSSWEMGGRVGDGVGGCFFVCFYCWCFWLLVLFFFCNPVVCNMTE